jgi:hypothetical protein
MSIQFAGSKSLDDRRRRRLVVNSDEPGADGTATGQRTSTGQISSELVASEAAAPWVPVYEWRLWTYAALIGLVVSAAAFALARPIAFRPELAPLTRHLLDGDRPVLAILIQTTFCFFAAQLSLLIGWYRAQCKLDFRGHYRVWYWAAVVFSIAAVCSATNAHGLLGQIIENTQLFSWRPRVVSWLLPALVVSLPLVLLLDRDVRRKRSSLYTLRLAWLLALVSAGFELFATEVHARPWGPAARVILPMFAMGAIFVGFWLHARVVAYICPDPPEQQQTKLFAQLAAFCGGILAWIAARFVWRRAKVDDAKAKKGRKKAGDEEEAAPKRKRRAPAKRKPRTRVKPAEEVEEEEEEEVEEEEQDTSEEGYEEESEESDEEEETSPVRSGRDAYSRPSQTPQNRPSNSGWNERSTTESEEEDDDDDEDDDDGTMTRRDSGVSADQLRGLSKRQKRELRRQAREQQRNQRR